MSTEQVWEDFRSRLRGFLLGRVRDEALADDLLQETFIRIHRSLGSVRDPSRLLPWLSRVARSVVADHFRKTSPDRPAREVARSSAEGEPDNLNEELGRCLAGMASNLPTKYRQAFELVETQGRKQREAAAQLGLSLSGAKSRVQRARRMLKDSFLECCEVEFDRRGNVLDYHVRSGCGDSE